MFTFSLNTHRKVTRIMIVVLIGIFIVSVVKAVYFSDWYIHI